MCGWSGMLVSRALCPQCQRHHTFRITGPREEALRAFARGEQPVMWAITRNWLLWNGLIVPITGKMPPAPGRHVRGKRRLFKLTALGEQAIGDSPAQAGTHNEAGSLDPIARAAEKSASREADERALATGEKTREDLRRENAAFAFPRDRVNLTFPKSYAKVRKG